MARQRGRTFRESALACVVATSIVCASTWSSGGTADAAGAPDVTVSPAAIAPADQYYQTTRAFAGTGAVVTVTVAPNKVLRPGFPVEVQECDADPSSLNDCDVLTTLPYDQLTKRRVLAAANGSVVTHFLLWSPLPDKWDPVSVITVGPGHPATLWVGDDPSQWATTGVVSAPVSISGPGSKSSAGAPAPEASARLARSSSSSSSPTGVVVLVAVAAGAALAGVGVGVGVVFSRRRRPGRPFA